MQPVKNQTTVPTTLVLKPVNRRPEIIFVSPTRGTLTLDKLTKSTQDITARVEQRVETCQNRRNVLSQTPMTNNSYTDTNDQNIVG